MAEVIKLYDVVIYEKSTGIVKSIYARKADDFSTDTLILNAMIGLNEQLRAARVPASKYKKGSKLKKWPEMPLA